MQLIRYAITFLVYGVLGYYFERYIVGRGGGGEGRDAASQPPFLLIYGVGAVILAVLDDAIHFDVVNPIVSSLVNLSAKVMTATILLTILECLGGHLRVAVSGYKTWDYAASGDHYTCCDGFVSLKASAMWALLSFLFFVADPVSWMWRLLSHCS